MYGPGSNPVRLQCATLTPLATLDRHWKVTEVIGVTTPVKILCATVTPLATLNRQYKFNGVVTLNYLVLPVSVAHSNHTVQ